MEAIDPARISSNLCTSPSIELDFLFSGNRRSSHHTYLTARYWLGINGTSRDLNDKTILGSSDLRKPVISRHLVLGLGLMKHTRSFSTE